MQNDKTQNNIKNNESKQIQQDDKKIDEAISESFPASDPPAWYAGEDKVKSKRRPS